MVPEGSCWINQKEEMQAAPKIQSRKSWGHLEREGSEHWPYWLKQSYSQLNILSTDTKLHGQQLSHMAILKNPDRTWYAFHLWIHGTTNRFSYFFSV